MLPLLLIAAVAPVDWQPYSPEVFVRAEAEHRLVLLDVGAGWCHWCHVMDEITYQDPEVVRVIGERFIAVRADADRFPELAQRYEDYGWPATIVLAADGTELVKLRGYLPPLRMSSMLAAVVEDPTPGPSAIVDAPFVAVPTHALSDAQKSEILERWFAVYDREHGGWGTVHRYLHADSAEYALLSNDPKLRAMAKQTLDANLRLIDPKGGIYQYSDGSKEGDPWGSPHFEKIMEMQANNLRIYSLAYLVLADPRYEAAADSIHRFLIDRLRSPSGAFYTSQDADSPRIDRHRFARENGWAIAALCAYASAFGDEEAIAQARRAAEWIIEHRRREDGTFGHGHRSDRPTLGDDIAMAEALLALFEVTQEPLWLTLAGETLAAIDRLHRAPNGGYQTATLDPDARGAMAQPYLQIEENLAVARAANRLSHYTGDAPRKIAEHAMRFLSSPSVTSQRRFLIGLLSVDHELAVTPAELTIIGAKNDASARRLFRAALALPAPYRRVRWLDPADPASKYPRRPAPAAYLCVAGACSRPLVNPEDLPRVYAGVTHQR